MANGSYSYTFDDNPHSANDDPVKHLLELLEHPDVKRQLKWRCISVVYIGDPASLYIEATLQHHYRYLKICAGSCYIKNLRTNKEKLCAYCCENRPEECVESVYEPCRSRGTCEVVEKLRKIKKPKCLNCENKTGNCLTILPCSKWCKSSDHFCAGCKNWSKTLNHLLIRTDPLPDDQSHPFCLVWKNVIPIWWVMKAPVSWKLLELW